MRCPKCDFEQKYHSGRTCLKCKYKYVFDPKKDGLTDYRFKRFIEKMDEDATVHCYTINQLHTTYINKYQSEIPKTIFFSVLFIFFFCLFLGIASTGDILCIIPFIVMIAVGFGVRNAFSFQGMPSEKFKGFVYRWKNRHPIPKLLRKTSLHEPPPDFEESDIYHYGTEGILIVDQDLYVDLLVKNNNHSDWKVVIISQNGYPEYLQGKIQKILDEDSNVKLYYLHDVATDIVDMKEKTKTFLKIPKTISELDFGLFNDSVQKMKIRNPDFKEDGKVDQLPPRLLKFSMSQAIIGGLLLGEVLNMAEKDSGFISDFG